MTQAQIPISATDRIVGLDVLRGLAIFGILDGNNDEEKAKVENAVYSQEPLRSAIFARFMFLLGLLILYTPFYLGWRTLALFMIGAGLVKLGWLDRKHSSS